MTAREMFEEIGYTYNDFLLIDGPAPGYMYPQCAPYLEYREAELDENGKIQREEIIKFMGGLVTVRARERLGDDIYIFPAPLNPDEIKAITQQLKELGWWKEE